MNNINKFNNQFLYFLLDFVKSNPNFIENNMNIMNNMNNLNFQFLYFFYNFVKINPNFMESIMNNKNNNMNMNNLIQMNFENNPIINMNIMNNINNFNNNIPIISKPNESSMNNNDKNLKKIIKIESVILINKSKDINDEQYDMITQICSNAINEEKDLKIDIAIYCAEKIRKKFNGQWFVLIQNKDDKNFEFGFSKIKFKNILIFQNKEKIIYITPLNIKKNN